MSCSFLRQPLNLELIDRQFCFTPAGTERQTGKERQVDRDTDWSVSITHHDVYISV